MSAVNPKNLIMAAGAGVVIGGAEASLDTGAQVVSIAIFTVIAAASVAVPVIAYLVASDKRAGPPESMHQWLVKVGSFSKSQVTSAALDPGGDPRC